MSSRTIFACDPQPVVLEGLRRVLEKSDEFQLIGWSHDINGALEKIGKPTPDIVLIDLGRGWREVHGFVIELNRLAPRSRCILWGQDISSNDCYRAVQIGVRGVFQTTLPTATLLDCFREVSAGNVWLEANGDQQRMEPRRGTSAVRLTPRERDIVELVAQGMRNREIAARLSITTGTVKVHLMHVFEKTGVKDRYELAVQARGLLDRAVADR